MKKVTLQDNTISYFDAAEHFKKEHLVHSTRMHIKIFFMEVLNQWISVSAQN